MSILQWFGRHGNLKSVLILGDAHQLLKDESLGCPETGGLFYPFIQDITLIAVCSGLSSVVSIIVPFTDPICFRRFSIIDLFSLIKFFGVFPVAFFKLKIRSGVENLLPIRRSAILSSEASRRQKEIGIPGFTCATSFGYTRPTTTVDLVICAFSTARLIQYKVVSFLQEFSKLPCIAISSVNLSSKSCTSCLSESCFFRKEIIVLFPIPLEPVIK